MTDKPFTWTFSRIKNFQSCPKKYYHVEVSKEYPFEDNAKTIEGKEIHAALARRIKQGFVLPVKFAHLENYAVGVLTGQGKVYVEQKYALTDALEPTGYYADDVWVRAIADVVKVKDDMAMAIDWKNGKETEDSPQLGIIAQAVFSTFPQVQFIRSKYVWFQSETETVLDFRREDMPMFWVAMRRDVQDLKDATDNFDFPPVQNGLCKNYCPVKSCPFNGQA